MLRWFHRQSGTFINKGARLFVLSPHYIRFNLDHFFPFVIVLASGL
ncbi:hypothetical protein QWZ16_17675 [Vibrio ostreicida]|uniref:Uncharacterized protein n=1 Tax=Vibrio ostreicida TaxID=526588 RepID=A0ABT8BW81_9VIBR|nr:hypothetical protein [Vibrio ostreicida]MDN3611432.1 hypothetical protein [Vibrio ostreicida]